MQINLTFKDTKKERELYVWLKSQIGMGAYIKQILYKQYLSETAQVTTTFTQNTATVIQQQNTVINTPEEENMNIDFGEWGM